MNQDELREKMYEIIDMEQVKELTEWENKFIADMHDWQDDFTEWQAACIEKIWNKYCQ